MYVIITYDVGEKRVAKVCKKLKAYLDWSQNSVFEGVITKSKLMKCMSELEKIITSNDSIYLYIVDNPNNIKKEVMGEDRSLHQIMF